MFLALLALLAQEGTYTSPANMAVMHKPIENKATVTDLDAAKAKISEWETYAKSLQSQLNALAQKYGQCTVSNAILEAGKPVAPPAPLPVKE